MRISETFPRCAVACVLAVAWLLSTAMPSAGTEAGVTQEVTRQRSALLGAMAPAQRQALQQRLALWQATPLHVREDARARYQAWRQLDEAERTRLRILAAQIAAYPEARRQALRAQFDALPDLQRRGWRLGPSLGQDYAVLHPLLAYVPATQRGPLLDRLRAMDARQRAQLGELAQRTPPQSRAGLRSELLAVPPSMLDAWLARRLVQ